MPRKPAPRATCSIDECQQVVYGHGWCLMHYTRWRRYGDPLHERPVARTASAVRTCKVCRETSDNFRGQKLTCRDCEAKQQRERYQAGGEEARRYSREAQRLARERDVERVRERQRRASQNFRERHRKEIRLKSRITPERYREAQLARNAVARAIKNGRLIRPETCEQCGSAGYIEAAHADYSKRFEVRWLCRRCHRQWDAQEPKTK